MSTELFDLFLIDSSVDFCDPKGSIYVPGAWDDANRTMNLIMQLGIASRYIKRIFVAMDEHHAMDITHPGWWLDDRGEHPESFTFMTWVRGSVVGTSISGVQRFYTATVPELMDKGGPGDKGTMGVMEALAKQGKGLMVWPEHNVVGTPGQALVTPVRTALRRWELATGQQAHWKFKGQCPWTENHGAFQAEIYMEDDRRTWYDAKLLRELMNGEGHARRKLIAGQASTHCVPQTVRQMMAGIVMCLPQDIVMLTDTMSPVTGHEDKWTAFRDEFEPLGMTFTTTLELAA